MRESSDSNFVLTHCDLSARNIMVEDDKITGILDWEHSGFFPKYMEYATAMEICDGRGLVETRFERDSRALWVFKTEISSPSQELGVVISFGPHLWTAPVTVIYQTLATFLRCPTRPSATSQSA
jgi:hypothetical protein